MLKEKDAVIRKAMLLFDAFVVSVSFSITFLLRQNLKSFYKLDMIPSTDIITDMSGASLNDYLVVLFFIVPIWCIMLYLSGMYRSMRTKTILEAVWILIKASFFTTLAFGTIVFLFKMKFVSRAFFVIFLALSSLAILTEKIVIFSIMHYVRRQGYNYRRFIVVGTGKRAARFIERIRHHPEWGLRIEGIVDYEKEHVGREVEGVKVIGTLEDLQRILHDNPIDEVVFIVPRAVLSRIEGSVYICETEGVKATIAVDLFDVRVARSRLTELEGVPLITFETTFAEEWQLFIKRAVDIIASGIGIIALSPLFLVTALLIKMTSPGPVFYRQKRVGQNGRRFVLYKFRSMYEGAHEKLSELMAMNVMKGPVFKMKDDPRVTPLGRLLRKLSIDELPQLFNVFMGQMSLVGPRPPLAKEVAQYEPWQRRRLSMRPGITCIWQISGRNNIDFEDWMRLDLEYIDNWSLWLDFKILVKTIPVVLFGIGAY
ncbi:MAG: sugar transferase [Candidatus Omnitrophota bacterium]